MSEGLEDRSLMTTVGIDPNFGFGGLSPLVFNPGGNITSNYASISEIARQADGKIVAAGSYSSHTRSNGSTPSSSIQDLMVYRFNADGSTDTAFGNGGMQHVALKSGDAQLDTYAQDVAIQADGKIVVLATAWSHYNPSNTSPYINDFAVVRFNSNGSLDTSFDGDGYKLIDFDTTGEADANSWDTAQALALAPDGKIVVVGSTETPGKTVESKFVAGSEDFAVARLNSDGSLDSSFSGDGKAVIDFAAGGGNNDSAYAVLVQPDGKVIAAGAAEVESQSKTTNGYTETRAIHDFALARLNYDGSLDTSFDNDGKTLIAFNYGGSNDDVADAVAFMPGTYEILVGGKANVQAPPVGGDGPDNSIITMARLNNNGSLDNSFGSGGKMPVPLIPGGVLYSGNATSFEVQPDHSVLVGATLSGPSSMATLLKLNPGGGLDPGFGYGGFALLPGSMGTRVVTQDTGKIVFGAFGGLTRTTAPPLPIPQVTAAETVTSGTGRNLRLGAVRLKLNTPVNPLLASKPSTYQLSTGTGRGARSIPLGQISYDPASMILTLPLARPMNVRANQALALRILANGLIGPGATILNNGADLLLNVAVTPPPTA